MIKLPESGLAPAERFALELLADLAGLVPAAQSMDVTRVDLSEQPARTLHAWVEAGWGIEAGDGVVRLPRALLRVVIDVAGGAAEQRSTARDRYARVPSSANPLVQESLERDPVIQRAALAFQAFLDEWIGG